MWLTGLGKPYTSYCYSTAPQLVNIRLYAWLADSYRCGRLVVLLSNVWWSYCSRDDKLYVHTCEHARTHTHLHCAHMQAHTHEQTGVNGNNRTCQVV